ncbi:MAG: N-acetylneuraminate synthase [Eubacterium sp.]|nr:N-acetylneuraminate synthase [Eubacterium sp.]
MPKVKIVAEIGCNHNGDISLARKLIEKAKEAGADAVKFQTFRAESLVSADAPLAEYQKAQNNTSQYEMLKSLELSNEDYMSLKSYAEQLGIECFSTAFDMDSVDFLAKTGQSIWKIPSGEITNIPYLEKIRDVKIDNKEIILSTGMSTMEDISLAVSVLEKSENTSFTILHCNTEYPTADGDMNLLAMMALKDAFPKWSIGLSDHSAGVVAPIMAVALGATFIEKHFTSDKSLPGPDHKASITPDELCELCQGVRRAEKMLGRKEKIITDSEQKNIVVARKSIVAKRAIKKGEILSVDNLTCKRPGSGISPKSWYSVIGTAAIKDFEKDELIQL